MHRPENGSLLPGNKNHTKYQPELLIRGLQKPDNRSKGNNQCYSIGQKVKNKKIDSWQKNLITVEILCLSVSVSETLPPPTSQFSLLFTFYILVSFDNLIYFWWNISFNFNHQIVVKLQCCHFVTNNFSIFWCIRFSFMATTFFFLLWLWFIYLFFLLFKMIILSFLIIFLGKYELMNYGGSIS